jgi:hypothetical protein
MDYSSAPAGIGSAPAAGSLAVPATGALSDAALGACVSPAGTSIPPV